MEHPALQLVPGGQPYDGPLPAHTFSHCAEAAGQPEPVFSVLPPSPPQCQQVGHPYEVE